MSGIKNIYHCPLKWNELDNHSNAKYCAECNKPIEDFTTLTTEQIKQKLLLEGAVCARMNIQQLNSENHYSKLSLSAIALSIGFLSFGVVGVSQNKNISSDTLKTEQAILKKVRIGGQIKERKNSEPIPFASLVLKDGEKVITKAMSDIDGNYQFELNEDSLNAKEITLRCVMVGYQSMEVKNIRVDHLKKQKIDLKVDVSPEVEILGIMIYEPVKPEYDFPFQSGKTYNREELNKRPK